MSADSRPKRKGGSARNRARKRNAPVIHKPALVRSVPLYEVLDSEGVEMIHDFAMRVIEQVGCEFRDEESLDYWRTTDAEIEGYLVKIDRKCLMALIDQAPSSYLHHARNPKRTVRVGDGSSVIAPSYGPPFVLDMQGQRRYANRQDLDNFQKLNHMASAVHIAGGPIVEPMDIPVPHRHLYMTYSGLKWSDKPLVGNVTARSRAEDTLEMLKIVFGDSFVNDNTVTTSLINANSPLVWDSTMLDALKVYAASNQAVLVSPFSMTAASMPASNIGTIAVVVAEALIAIAMAQLIRPGCPMVFGLPSMTVALDTGAPVHGSPDSAMVQFMASQMARKYQLPHRAIMNVATSKSVDIQAGYDSMWGLVPSFLSGANWMTMSGGLIEGSLTQSYAKAMIDFEQLDAFYHFCQGYDVSDMDEIFETVKNVGPGGHFLGEAHTRKSNLHIFPSQNNVTYEQWKADGSKDAASVGVEKARLWLDRYQPPDLDPQLDKALLEFIERKEKEISSEVS